MKSLLLVAVAVAAAVAARPSPTTPQPKPAADDRWARAAPGYVFRFPRDHASHPEYKIEWWYYTGNLAGAGAHYGYQLTFFRIGVNPAPASRSIWAVRDLFAAHAALTDIDGRRFHFADRLNRAGPDWAGAAADRYRVWNEDWQAALEPGGQHHLQANAPDFGLDQR